MNDFENKLNSLNMYDTKAPDNLEELLRNSLNTIEDKPKTNKTYNSKLFRIAASFLVILVLFNLNSVSAFFKTLLGYDDYFQYNEVIKELNEQNKIQTLNQTITLDDGTEVILEGILSDGAFVSIFAKMHEKDYSSLMNFDLVDGRSLTSSTDTQNDYCYIVYSYFKEEIESLITLQISKGEIKKSVDINIDTSTFIDAKTLTPQSNTITIDEVTFTLNSTRVSPMSVMLDYTVTSENKEKVKLIQAKIENSFNPGIEFTPQIQSNSLDITNFGYLNLNESIIENGAQYRQLIYCNNIQLTELKDLEIIIAIAGFSTELTYSSPNELNNVWINDDLYIESFDGIELKYWSRHFKDIPKYSIQPINRLYMSDYTPTTEFKKLLGKNYKHFSCFHVGLLQNDFNGNIITPIIIENKAYNISEKEKSIIINID